ncbi:MAG: hypothetical protein JWM32_1259 [Verrucomicrobia bacterium]|nr:hypothetical protein [Verrucomicrobiota bacterium]
MTSTPIVIRVLSLMSLVAGGAMSGQAAEKITANDPPVMMNAFKVEDAYSSQLSFGLSLDIWEDQETKMVKAIYVKKVKADSPADYAGIKPMSRIYTLDGQSVGNMSPTFKKDSVLNRLLVNRKTGETLIVELTVFGKMGSQTVVLTEGIHRELKWQDR